MSNTKYQLIPTEEGLYENKPSKWITKIGLICVLLMIVAIYTLSSAGIQLDSSTVKYPSDSSNPWEISTESSTPNTPSVSEALDNPYETSTYGAINVTTVTQNSTLNATIDPVIFQTEKRYQAEEEEETNPYVSISNTFSHVTEESKTEPSYELETKSGVKYFVNSDGCQMTHPNPFASNILKIYKKHSYIVCDSSRDMITVNFNETDSTYRLHKIDNSICCYKKILRAGVADKADHSYKLGPCVKIQQDFLVPTDVTAMIAYCHRPPHDYAVQKNVFSFVHPRKDSDKSPKSAHEKRPSVLLWGIDSVSRMTIELTMPKMYEYLKTSNWFELQGYNKMGDNTFPNLMAVLTGFNKTFANAQCRPDKVGGLDACPLIWKDYQARGYTTAFAEDWSPFSTFDYSSMGFLHPPTDAYGRPLILAAEKELKVTHQSQLPYCLGRKPAAEYIYDLGVQFTRVNRNRTFFGMFWTNTFSHNDFTVTSAMDAKMVEYMRTLEKKGVMDNTIIIFFSDHGSRFGPLRILDSGFVEERLPFIYFHVPLWIQDKYPKLLRNLRVNKNRLTSPYDIHATLKHILELDTPPEKLPHPDACPSCQSVFLEMNWSRNCSQAGIEKHWCACDSSFELPTKDPRAKVMSTQLVDAINKFVSSKKGTKRCRRLRLNRIISVQQRSNSNHYLVQVKAQPRNAIFEATVDWDPSAQTISIRVPSVSRLDTYFGMSGCSSVKETKKFCIC